MSFSQGLVAVAPLLGVAGYSLAHVLVSRSIPRKSPYIALAMGFLIGGLLAAAITIGELVHTHATIADGLCLTILNCFTYIALSFGYFNFVNLTLVSLRIRILEEIADEGGSITKATLGAEYGNNDVGGVRLDRLIRGQFLVERNGRLYSGKASFLVLSRLFDLLRWFILGAQHPVVSRTFAKVPKGTP